MFEAHLWYKSGFAIQVRHIISMNEDIKFEEGNIISMNEDVQY